MSERGADFDAKREAYEAAQQALVHLTENPDKDMTIEEYRARVRKALAASRRAHKAMLAAWSA